MKNKRRSAFTIVELVIVIAVIAILSAVLIPTFGSIIKNANVAADQSTAATLTTELHVYLKGKQITNESELVEALDKSGIGTKLIPSVENAHYWFDMDSQMIVVKELDEVNPRTRAASPANTSFRDLYNKGLYLIDHNVLGELFSTADVAYDVFSYIDNLATADQYANLISKLGSVAENHVYKTIATDILAKLHNTTIRTEAGAFFSAEGNATKNEYFSAGATFVGNDYFKFDGERIVDADAAPLPVGVVSIPSNINYVSEDALLYENTDDSRAQISIDRNRAGILSPGFTNADVLIGDKTYIIPSTDINPAEDLLVNVADSNDTIQLIIKLPFEDFNIYYDGTKKIAGTANGKIFVAYRDGTLQLIAVNKDNAAQTSNKIQSWSIIDGENGDFEINSTGLINFENAEFVELSDGRQVCEVTVKAETLNVNNETRTETINIVIVKPLASTLKIVSTTSQNVALGTNKSISLDFTGEFTSYEILPGVTYSSEVVADGETPTDAKTLLSLSPVYAVADNSNFHFDVANNKLVFKAVDANGDEVYDNGTYSFVISVDNGCLSTTVTATMNNSEDTIFKTNNHHSSTIARPFYIGSGNEISLGDLFNAASTDFGSSKIEKATVNIYDNVGATGKLYPIYLADRTPNNFSVKQGENTIGSLGVSYSDWTSQKISFVFEDIDSTTHISHDVYIEIIPETNDNVTDAISTVVKFTVIKGAENVSDINDLKPSDSDEIVLDQDIILHGDSDVSTGTTIDAGDFTLYGNGYTINAREYVASEVKDGNGNSISGTNTVYRNICHNTAWYHDCSRMIGCDYRYSTSTENYSKYYETDQYMILVNNGSIDNIYINGPVYPEVQYYEDTFDGTGEYSHTPFYVSGIKSTGDSSITNSYISGFRQPVKAEGTSLSLNNTTLRGGNFANLVLSTGILDLEDVTTIQDQGGMLNTVAFGSTTAYSVSVTGLGIAIERTAITLVDRDDDGSNDDARIKITGYLNQYNWISEDTTAQMPVIDGVNLKSVFGYVFDGVKVELLNMNLYVGRLAYYKHQNTASTPVEYVNAGIMFAEIGRTGSITDSALTDENCMSSGFISHGERDGDVNYAERTLEKVELEKFANLGLSGIYTAEKMLGKDGKVVLFSYKDGRGWTANTTHTSLTPTNHNTDIKLADGTMYPINYIGYYDMSGDYSSWYQYSVPTN